LEEESAGHQGQQNQQRVVLTAPPKKMVEKKDNKHAQRDWVAADDQERTNYEVVNNIAISKLLVFFQCFKLT
jgi:hypothetical protein